MIEILDNDGHRVAYQTPYSAGFDIPAKGDYTIAPGEWALIKTGLFLAPSSKRSYQKIFEAVEEALPWSKQCKLIPELQIRGRSGLALKKGITVIQGVGTVDADYPGEIGVILMNHGKEPFVVNDGDRVAQGVVNLTVRLELHVCDRERTGGYGSTNGGSAA